MKSYGSRAFAVAAPGLRNSLPDNIRSCDNLPQFYFVNYLIICLIVWNVNINFIALHTLM